MFTKQFNQKMVAIAGQVEMPVQVNMAWTTPTVLCTQYTGC